MLSHGRIEFEQIRDREISEQKPARAENARLLSRAFPEGAEREDRYSCSSQGKVFESNRASPAIPVHEEAGPETLRSMSKFEGKTIRRP